MRQVMLFAFAFFLFTALAISDSGEAQKQAEEFLTMYDSLYQKMYTVDAEASWLAGTDVTEIHTGQRIGADSAYAAFLGNTYLLNRAQELLRQKDQLAPLSVRQLQKILYNGAHSPGSIPEIVQKRVEAEAKQSATLDGFEFCAEKQGDKCVKPVTPNQIDDVLRHSTDLTELCTAGLRPAEFCLLDEPCRRDAGVTKCESEFSLFRDRSKSKEALDALQ